MRTNFIHEWQASDLRFLWQSVVNGTRALCIQYLALSGHLEFSVPILGFFKFLGFLTSGSPLCDILFQFPDSLSLSHQRSSFPPIRIEIQSLSVRRKTVRAPIKLVFGALDEKGIPPRLLKSSQFGYQISIH